MNLPTQQQFEANLATTTPPHVEETDECDICRNSFTNPVRTPCNHVFCSACLLRAFQRTNTCPHCRHILFRNRPNAFDVRPQLSNDGDSEEDYEEGEIRVIEEIVTEGGDESDPWANTFAEGNARSEQEEMSLEENWRVGLFQQQDELEWTNDHEGHPVTESQAN
ncbi:hypothetical protein CERZMDRAFT_91277 [Cercospora zeae-maydis SCOH1-5]|uniref:RING-type domain-containing protein n=1 Tax=Cercospora zeae-maydis SCOH1-5 TaxID=717836 RepID=A0A6A6F9A3_9PEZI|nr:hypothetical protein CERZMDRAFT_91277 [Cercospora zeae-maydis SCOH1-5]